jgi:hypothetical protein
MEGLKIAECIVTDCAATMCKYNKNRMCQLDRVTIDQNAKCNMFEKGSGGGHKNPFSTPSGGLPPFSDTVKDIFQVKYK